MCIKHIYYWRIRTSQYFWIFLFLVETKLIVWLCDYFRKSIFRSIYWFIFAMIYISNISNLCPQLLTNWKSTRREGKGSTLTFSIRSKARQSKAKQSKAKQSKGKQSKGRANRHRRSVTSAMLMYACICAWSRVPFQRWCHDQKGPWSSENSFLTDSFPVLRKFKNPRDIWIQCFLSDSFDG